MIRQPLLRLIVAYGMGIFCLAEFFNPNFWRSNHASWNPFVHLFVALFGIAWFIQAAVLHKQLSNQRG
jgi:hypothetical protein